jgi:methionine synthase / methylenetetrahydrofolate reductase (NADH)
MTSPKQTPPQSLADPGRADLRERLLAGPLVFDGAMGTMLNERGVAFNECFELCNIDRAQQVADIHRAFLDAGAEGVHSNTFGANRYRLAQHEMGRRLGEFIAAGVQLARETAGPNRYVIASLGPTGIAIEPIGRVSRIEARMAYQEAASAFDATQIDAFSLETFSNLDELIEAVRGIRMVSDLPLFAHFTVTGAGVTLMGTHPEEACQRLEKEGVDVVGVNCSTGPSAVLEATRLILDSCNLPVSARPNAGVPREVDGRVFYENNPDYFGRFARRFLQAGGSLLGGCCGTTPEHMRAMARAARAVGAQHRGHHAAQVRHVTKMERPLSPVPLAERSSLGKKLGAASCPVSVELLPPRTPVTDGLLEAARVLQGAGADVINLPDGPRASARISNMVAAFLIEQKVGIETLMHFCCRDRNLLGMQSDLMGAAALGLSNLLVITGDPPYQGNYPDVTAVFDVDAIGLCNVIDGLNHGLDVGGNHLNGQTQFCFGAAFNPTAVDLERELHRYDWKVQSGMNFAITQPIFDVDQFVGVLAKLPKDSPPIMAGVWPLRSLRNTEFLASEVPGVVVPDAVIERMREADQHGKAPQEGLAIARETIEALHGRVAGFQIAAPFNKTDAAVELLHILSELR